MFHIKYFCENQARIHQNKLRVYNINAITFFNKNAYLIFSLNIAFSKLYLQVIYKSNFRTDPILLERRLHIPKSKKTSSSLDNFTINDNFTLHITRQHIGTNHIVPVARTIRVFNKLTRNITVDKIIHRLCPMEIFVIFLSKRVTNFLK